MDNSLIYINSVNPYILVNVMWMLTVIVISTCLTLIAKQMLKGKEQ